jgi:hypothetical protein
LKSSELSIPRLLCDLAGVCRPIRANAIWELASDFLVHRILNGHNPSGHEDVEEFAVVDLDGCRAGGPRLNFDLLKCEWSGAFRPISVLPEASA